jgi:hypothetical protein
VFGDSASLIFDKLNINVSSPRVSCALAVNGKEYIVIAISGQEYNDEYVAFKLP